MENEPISDIDLDTVDNNRRIIAAQKLHMHEDAI